jgi:ATP-binding cassette subfamily B protein RaxB
MMACAQVAGVHDEIMAMPMGYSSLIGDMGSSLSGGQKQRVLLTRALYKRPRIISLDGEPLMSISPRRRRSTNGCGNSASRASALRAGRR